MFVLRVSLSCAIGLTRIPEKAGAAVLMNPRQAKTAAIAHVLVASLLLGAGCASAPPAATPSPPGHEAAVRIADPDARLSVKRLSREQVLTVLGPHGQRLSESATVLEVAITPVASPAQLSESSFRLRLPTGEAVDPLEPKWVLAAMDLPGDAAPSGRGETSWPVFDEPDDVGTALLDIALVSVLVVAIGVKAVIDSSKSKARLHARSDVWDMVALPRTVGRGRTARLLVVYWPRFGRVPAGIPLPLEVRFELEHCTWQAEIVIPAD